MTGIVVAVVPANNILIYSAVLTSGPVKQNRRNNYNAEYVLTTDRNQSYEEISIKDALDIQNAAFMMLSRIQAHIEVGQKRTEQESSKHSL
ncbi:MAG: hypothetical protein CXZ00_16760 [Acidobacteria bacterium]|nr:MAG: hypothetical protein CXZ00_16760 [Acidobacteriota bacterium]